MNKQIQEVVVDATLYADYYCDRDCASWHQFYNEKFAELMIEEFLEIADSNLHPQVYAQVLAAVQQRFEIK